MERHTTHTYIYIEKISIDITSVGLTSARPNKLNFRHFLLNTVIHVHVYTGGLNIFCT